MPKLRRIYFNEAFRTGARQPRVRSRFCQQPHDRSYGTHYMPADVLTCDARHLLLTNKGLAFLNATFSAATNCCQSC